MGKTAKTNHRGEQYTDGGFTYGPGRNHRTGLSYMGLFDKFSNEISAVKWFESMRWGQTGRDCPFCGDLGTYKTDNKSRMEYRCSKGGCYKFFNVKTDTPMQNTKLPLRTWVVAIYFMSVSTRGVASMKTHRDLGVTQKTAWMLGQKIRRGFESGSLPKIVAPSK